MKDISDYLQFEGVGGPPKRSIKSVLNLPAVVKGWKLMESKFRDGNPSGHFVQLLMGIDGKDFLVNTGSEIIMEQLAAVRAAQERSGEGETAFTCVVRRSGRGVKLFPERSENVGQEKREEA